MTVAVALAGCSGDGTRAPHLLQGYLATDGCTKNVTQTDCDATERGCRWITTKQVGVCVANDTCLSLGKAGCSADATCAWSAAATLCPVGADCGDGGYCHSRDQGGTDCACVSPISSNANGTVPAVECDCSGGGGGTTGSGGACSCACATCAPGEICPPCACDCNDGGSGCGSGSTCACACPALPDGTVAPDCVCNWTDGGGTTTVSPACACAPGENCACATAAVDGGMTCVVPPTPMPTPVVCSAIACAKTCTNGLATDASGCTTCVCN